MRKILHYKENNQFEPILLKSSFSTPSFHDKEVLILMITENQFLVKMTFLDTNKDGATGPEFINKMILGHLLNVM